MKTRIVFQQSRILAWKCKGPIPSPKGKLIDLDNLPQMQQEVNQSSQQPFYSFIMEKNILLVMGSLYVGHFQQWPPTPSLRKWTPSEWSQPWEPSPKLHDKTRNPSLNAPLKTSHVKLAFTFSNTIPFHTQSLSLRLNDSLQGEGILVDGISKMETPLNFNSSVTQARYPPKDAKVSFWYASFTPQV
jgi:hypothetical protein